jgi:Domain of Unknown Function (DUF1080)/PA14 domain
MMRKIAFLLLLSSPVWAQISWPLQNLSTFERPSRNWRVVGQIHGDFERKDLPSQSGTGVLLCQPQGPLYQAQDNLLSRESFGDLRLSLDFMLPKLGNSGVYLMGRYEVQLFDSWGVTTPRVTDCGSIYERWNEAQKSGYEGHTPRLNACKAPGLWQHLEVDFEAPRFDAAGQKIRPARFVKVTLNGHVIHENVVLSGPTRAAAWADEAAMGPLMLQGDHGPVAFRNIQYEAVGAKKKVELGSVQYQIWDKGYDKIPEKLEGKILQEGRSETFSARLTPLGQGFTLATEATLQIPEDDTYTLSLHWTGAGKIQIDGQTILEKGAWYNEELRVVQKLSAGPHTLRLVYSKNFPWGPKALGLRIKRAGAVEQTLHGRGSLPEPEPVGLIEVRPSDRPEIQRSFYMFKGQKKTHVVSVGTPAGIHFSYNLNQGALLDVWRGKFLNTTDMWHERGEPQLAQAMGVSATQTGKFVLSESELQFPDSVGSELQYRGYQLVAAPRSGQRMPRFDYTWKDLKITDMASDYNGYGLERELRVEGPSSQNIYVLMAEGKRIEALDGGRYRIDDQYFIATRGPVSIRTQPDGQQFLVEKVNKSGQVNYVIFW